MITPRRLSEAYLRLALYILAAVLVNIAGQSLNARIDLTENNRYSLSELSKETVSGLREPLTVKAFFSKDMPPQYAETKRYLRDLLREYAAVADRSFNYEFVEVTGEGENAQRAQNYGIEPVQVQVVRKDELKYSKAYMGLVLMHGDAVARIPVVSSAGQLEYLLTSRMRKLTSKVSALLGLKDRIQVSLYLSPSLQEVAPHIGIKGLDKLPDRMRQAVDTLNERHYDKLIYEHREFEPEGNRETVEELDLQTLQWPSSEKRGIESGAGSIGLVLRRGDKARTVDLLSVSRLPMLGTRYQLVDTELSTLIGNNLESLLGIHQNLGYLTGHETLPLQRQSGRGRQQGPKTTAFRDMVRQGYTLQEVDLEQGVPEGLQTLVIAGPKKEFSDFELYQLDQALMRGTNLAVFLDSYVRRTSQTGRPGYTENTSGLSQLLARYGLSLENAVVMDERCFEREVSRERGGGRQPVYFAPKIAKENINHQPGFMKNIKGLITYKAAPVTSNSTRIAAQEVTAQPLYSSSERSWLQSGVVRLRPSLIAPPEDPGKMASHSLAYLAEGTFTSAFRGEPVPERERGGNGTNATQAGGSELSEGIRAQGGRLDRSEEPGRIALIGSSSMLTDQILSGGQGQRMSPNRTFVMNLLDGLSGRTRMARLRSEVQTFNPLDETTQLTRSAVKAANIAGLPLAVLLLGLGVWFARAGRRKQLARRFADRE